MKKTYHRRDKIKTGVAKGFGGYFPYFAIGFKRFYLQAEEDKTRALNRKRELKEAFSKLMEEI